MNIFLEYLSNRQCIGPVKQKFQGTQLVARLGLQGTKTADQPFIHCNKAIYMLWNPSRLTEFYQSNISTSVCRHTQE
jgi:hypothetical protein